MSNLLFVFDKMPSPDGCSFIEVENESGESVCAGEWRNRRDGLVELVVPIYGTAALQAELAALREELAQTKRTAITEIEALNRTLRNQASEVVAAEQRNAELLKAVEHSIEWFERISSGDGSGHADLARAIRRIAKLPKPTESGASE